MEQPILSESLLRGRGIYALAFRPDGKHGVDGLVRLYEVPSGRLLKAADAS